MTTSDVKHFVLAGKVYWAHVTKTNELSGKYQVDLSIDKATQDKLKSVGISIKNKDDERKDFVTLTSTFKPKVVDKDALDVPDDLLIGNGSELEVVTHLYDWKFKGKTGTSLGLDAIKIVELVPYTSKVVQLLTNK